MFSNIQQKIQTWSYRMEFNVERQQELLSLIGELLEYGIPLKTILTVNLRRIYTKGAMKVVIDNMAKTLARGESISSSMQGWFSPITVMLVAAGESGNFLPEALIQAAENLTAKRGALAAVMGALSYPIIVLIGSVLMLFLFQIEVIPRFQSFFPGHVLPPFGQLFHLYANIYTDGWPIWLAIILIFAFGLKPFLNRYVGPGRDKLDKWPIFTLFRNLVAAQWMETIGELNKSGILIRGALAYVKKHSLPYLHMHCLRAERNLRDGRRNVGEVLDTGMIDNQTAAVLQVVSEIGKLDEKMIEIGNNAYNHSLKRLTNFCRVFGYCVLCLSAFNIVFSISVLYVTGSALYS